MTQDTGLDAPDESYRLYRIFDGVAKLLADGNFIDAYSMVKVCRDEFNSRCGNVQRDVARAVAGPPKNSAQAITREETQRRWAERNPLTPVAHLRGQR